MCETHFEEFVCLADVTEEAALLAWGGFWFRRDGPHQQWQVVADAALDELDPGRTGTIGTDSQPYGEAAVTVTDESGATVAEAAATGEANHVWVSGLRPDTSYRYRVTVDGSDWATGERWDWGPGHRGGLDLGPLGRSYTMAFRTHPDRDTAAPLAFAVLGDFGVGFSAVGNHDSGRCGRRRRTCSTCGSTARGWR